MMRRLRRLLLVLAVLIVVGLGAGFAVFALRGSDAPPPPKLPAPRADATATATAKDSAPAGRATWEIAGEEGTFVGYRVREEFVSFGVVDAVGRTPEVTGTLEIAGDRVQNARLETDRFPTAEFELTGPFALSREPVPARGRLTLHGETQPIVARVSGQRDGADAIELAGSAPIAFADFGIQPPSVAGFVTVRDTGRLEFQLRLRPR